MSVCYDATAFNTFHWLEIDMTDQNPRYSEQDMQSSILFSEDSVTQCHSPSERVTVREYTHTDCIRVAVATRQARQG